MSCVRCGFEHFKPETYLDLCCLCGMPEDQPWRLAVRECPFCGEETRPGRCGSFSYAVVCEVCRAQGPAENSLAVAIAAWNGAPRPKIDAAKITPDGIKHFLGRHGWSLDMTWADGAAEVWRKQGEPVMVPLDASASDYADAVQHVADRLSDKRKKLRKLDAQHFLRQMLVLS